MKKFSKKTLSFMLVVIMLFSSIGTVGVLAERSYEADISILGKTVELKSAAYSKFDTVFVPLNEMLGYINLSYTEENGIYTINRMNTTATLESGNMVASSNGESVVLPASPKVENGVLYVPVEFFTVALDIPVTVAADKRSANMSPNVYVVRIDAQNAAAVSAAKPDSDVLTTAISGSDTLRDQMDTFPTKSSYVYYKANLDFFKGKAISAATLNMTVAMNEFGASVRAVRTAPWEKGQITWDNQPALYNEKTSAFGASSKTSIDISLDIKALTDAAMAEGTDLSVKIFGTHRAGEKNQLDKHAYTVKGVNTTNGPYIKMTLEENYSFPVKTSDSEDNESDSYYSNMGILRSIGVFTQNDEFPLDLNEGVLRQEFVRYALRLRNASVQKTGSEQFFSDVAPDSPYFAEIMTAYEMGYISGWQGIAFRPYDRITVGEAITILGRMLNYNVYADERGGFTPGYFAAARLGDLYIGSTSGSDILSFKKMFNLLEDALDAAILEVTSYSSNGGATYIFNENKNVLTEFWNASLIENTIVTANEYSTLVPGQRGKEGNITLGTKELRLLYKPYNDFLGYKIKAWYNNEDELLYIGSVSHDVKNYDVCTIRDVDDSVPGKISFTYKRDNGKIATETFRTTGYVIYNGRAIAANSVKEELIKKDGGNIKIVGEDLVVITAYDTVIVTSVDKENEIIHDLYDDYSNRIELDNKDYYQLTDTEGKDVILENLKSDDVISVAYSLDKKIIRGILSNNSFAGEIESIQDKGPDATVEISGKEYKFANYYKADGNENDWTKDIKLRLSGTFFVDAFGQIVGFRVNASGEYPGYILAIGKASRSGLDNRLLAAITTKSAVDYMEFEFAEKVKIDGAKAKKYDLDEILALPQFSDNGQFKKQGIIYTLNDEGKIKAIDTAIDATVENPVTYGDDIKYTLVKRHNINYTVQASDKETAGNAAGNNSYLRHKSTGTLSNRYWLNKDNTLYVTAPDVETTVDGVKYYYPTSDLDEFKYLPNTLSNDDYKHFDIYTVGNKTPDVLIAFYRGAATSALSGGFAVVSGMYYKYNDELGDVQPVLEYVTSPGKITEAVLSENCEYKKVGGEALTRNDIKIGDVIRLGKNYKDEIGIVQKYYDYQTKTLYAASEGSGENAPNIMYAFDSVPGYKNFVDDLSSPTKSLWFKTSAFTAVYPYNVEGRDVVMYEGTANDIIDYETVPYASSVVFFMTNYISASGAVIVAPTSNTDSGYYRVSFVDSANDTEGDLPATQFKDKGEALDNVSVVLTRPGNKQFVGWKYNGNVYTNDQLSNIVVRDENITLTAVWEDTHTITFKDKAGNSIVGDPVEGIAGIEVELPDYDIPNFELTGWSTTANADVAEYGVGETYTIGDEDVTLYAVGITIITYAVTFNNDGHGTAPASMNIKEGTNTGPLPDMADVEGYRFDGWKIGTTNYDVGYDYGPVNEDTEFTARWTASQEVNPELVGQALVKNADATSGGVTSNDYYALYSGNTAFYKFKIPTGYTLEEVLSNNFHIRFHKNRNINVAAHIVTSDFWQNDRTTLSADDLAKFTSIEKTQFATLDITTGDGYSNTNPLIYKTAWNTTDTEALASASGTLADNNYQYVVIALTSTKNSQNTVQLIDYKQSKYSGYLPELIVKAFPPKE